MKSSSRQPEVGKRKKEGGKQMTRAGKQSMGHRARGAYKKQGTAGFNFFLLCSVLSVLSSALCLLPAAYADEVNARAAVVIDGATEKILYAKNPHWKLQPASTTKLVTAMVALDRLNPDSTITISENAANTPSVSPHLRAGEKFTVRDVLHLALMRSINGAAVALAEAVAGSEDRFATMMNEKASLLGAENTWFVNATGLPGPGQYITAFDLAKVMREALKYPMIRDIIGTKVKEVSSEGGRRMVIKNTDHLLWSDDELIGGKTGYTRAAGHCFVCAAKRGQSTLITAVLGEHVRDYLWQDSSGLIARGYDVITHKSEPMIYLSAVKENPVVFASYKAKPKKRHRAHKYKGARKSARNSGNGKKILAVKKKHKKTKSAHVRMAKNRKGKKSSPKKHLSAGNHESVKRS